MLNNWDPLSELLELSCNIAGIALTRFWNCLNKVLELP